MATKSIAKRLDRIANFIGLVQRRSLSHFEYNNPLVSPSRSGTFDVVPQCPPSIQEHVSRILERRISPPGRNFNVSNIISTYADVVQVTKLAPAEDVGSKNWRCLHQIVEHALVHESN